MAHEYSHDNDSIATLDSESRDPKAKQPAPDPYWDTEFLQEDGRVVRVRIHSLDSLLRRARAFGKADLTPA